MRIILNDLINKIPDFFRWVLSLPISIVAMCLAQVILTFIGKFFFEVNKLQLFNSFPNEINYFLINFGATYVFLSVFYYCVPKYKFKTTFILALIYALLMIGIFFLLIINQRFSETFPFSKVLDEDVGIVFGCVVTILQMSRNKEVGKAKYDEEYHLYEKKLYKCRFKKCGWSGFGSEAERGEVFEDLLEILCPKCHEKIGLVLFPTLDQAMKNLDQYKPIDKMGFLLLKEKLKEKKK